MIYNEIPKAKKIPKEISIHGYKWTDNYFWLRNRDDKEVIDYLKDENKYTKRFMSKTKRLQKVLYNEMVSRIKEDDESLPVKIDNYSYYHKMLKGKEYPCYFRKKNIENAKEEVILDVNELAQGYSFFDIGLFRISPDHRYLAFSYDVDGDEVFTICFKDLETGKILNNKIENTYYSGEWTNDSSFFYFITLDDAKRPSGLNVHNLASNESNLVYFEPEEVFHLHVEKVASKKYIKLCLKSQITSEIRIAYADTLVEKFEVVIPRKNGVEYGIYHHGENFYVLTNENAVNFKICKMDISSKENVSEYIPHDIDVLIEDIQMFSSYMVIYLRDKGLLKFKIIDFSSDKEFFIDFDEEVYAVYPGSNPEFNSDFFRFSYSSLTTPITIFDFEFSTKKKHLKKQKEVLGGFDSNNYESKRLFATSDDGTEIPISIVYKKGIKLQNNNPLYLYAYGSYGISTDPDFSSVRISLLERGFIFALAHIRGGGDLGRTWYEDGKYLKKKNTFDDFISCARYLIDKNYTVPEKLAICGGSAGGLLMGAVTNMAPELFGAVIAEVPFVDVINTMLDPSLPLTVIEYEEWGNPQDKKYFEYMKSYSPYDNVESKKYPNMLVVAGLNDPRVQYWEPAKWVAKLRELKTDDNVLLLKTHMDEGHSGASGRYEYLKEEAFQYAFVLEVLDMNPDFEYPETKKVDITDDYHGTLVSDPYRWLEEDTPETQNWIAKQEKFTNDYFADITYREKIFARLNSLFDYPRYSVFRKYGDNFFYLKNKGLQKQSVLYMKKGLNAKPKILLDPNKWSDDGTISFIRSYVSDDGKLLAYAVSESGSDRNTIRVLDTENGTILDDEIKWCRFALVAWKKDKSGFFYNRYPIPETVPKEDECNFCQIYFHKMGDPQEKDKLVFEMPEDKEMGFSPVISDDGNYLVLYAFKSADRVNILYIKDLNSDSDFIRIIPQMDSEYLVVGNVGSKFYIETISNCKKGKIVSVDLNNYDKSNWKTIISESDDVIEWAGIYGDKIIICYLHNAYNILKVFSLDGKYLNDIELPGLGSVFGMSGKSNDSEVFFGFSSFYIPSNIYKYDVSSNKLTKFIENKCDFDEDKYVTKQIFYKSKDGTKIPMFISHKKNLVLDGNNPTLLYGYGGFNISLKPSFSIFQLYWMEQGGVYAVANIRGGGEFGENWHNLGKLDKKQNVFDDFIFAGKWLIEHKYTKSELLAIRGGSNGGLLVSACMLQEPELFGAVICGVPVIDMLRYHKFTVGRYWIPEYGNASQNSEHFKFIYKYSPLHNVDKNAIYPPIMILTADCDDRVLPAHAFKFTASLQNIKHRKNPVILRIERKSGHGHGKPLTKYICEATDIFMFLKNELQY